MLLNYMLDIRGDILGKTLSSVQLFDFLLLEYIRSKGEALSEICKEFCVWIIRNEQTVRSVTTVICVLVGP